MRTNCYAVQERILRFGNDVRWTRGVALAIRRRFPAAALALVLLAAAQAALAGVVVTREFRSTALARSWTYAVYLPTGYDTSDLG